LGKQQIIKVFNDFIMNSSGIAYRFSRTHGGFSLDPLYHPMLGLMVSPLAIAQSGSSAISGIVKDASGAAIPRAGLQVVSRETGVTLQTLSNERGNYRIASLVPETYRLEISAAGFQPQVRSPLTLLVEQVLAIDFGWKWARKSRPSPSQKRLP
jgi:hypothetical protein